MEHWCYRNEKLWNGVSRPSQITVSLAYDILTNWSQAQAKSPQGQTPTPNNYVDDLWPKPLDPSMKCNVNATISKDLQSIGFGVVRDYVVCFMVSKTCVKHGLFEVNEAEVFALLDDMS